MLHIRSQKEKLKEDNDMPPESNRNYPNRPLKPNEVLTTQMETFPEEAFIAVNGLIAERLNGQYAKFTIKALRKRMVELGLDQEEIKTRGWDRVGSIYKSNGWDVNYHYPASDDDANFDPYYIFKTDGYRSW